jgi:hypothetical protein
MMMDTPKILAALAVLATTAPAIAISAYPQGAHAQTNGMERRGERRDTRQTSRDVKHECNATSGNSRSDCRQGKRDVKQAGRHDQPTPTPARPPG